MKHFSKLNWLWAIVLIASALLIQSCELEKQEGPDDDGDGIANTEDNCPGIANGNQVDTDGDGLGDACEADTDEDGVIDDLDNCPTTANEDQADANDDGIGDVCEGDTDADGIPDFRDNCPEVANEDQADFDNDGIGDTCDETTVSEDREHVQSALDMTFNCVRNLKNGDGMDLIMEDMLAFSGGEFGEEVWVDAITEYLGDQVLSEVEEGNGVGVFLDQIGGTYEFNKADSSWTKTNSSSTSLELKFPSNKDQTSNNAVLSLAEYSDQELTIDGETYHLPTGGKISLTVDGVELMAVTINEVVYGTGDLPIPNKVDIALFVKPMTLQIVLESNSETEYAAEVTFTGDDGCTFGANVEVEFAHSDFGDLIIEEDIKKLIAEVKLQHMSIATVSDLASIFTLQDPTEQEINELVDLDILINNFKIADVEYSQNDEAVYLIFKDDTQENALEYFEDFFNDMLDLIEDYTGELFAEEAS